MVDYFERGARGGYNASTTVKLSPVQGSPLDMLFCTNNGWHGRALELMDEGTGRSLEGGGSNPGRWQQWTCMSRPGAQL